MVLRNTRFDATKAIGALHREATHTMVCLLTSSDHCRMYVHGVEKHRVVRHHLLQSSAPIMCAAVFSRFMCSNHLRGEAGEAGRRARRGEAGERQSRQCNAGEAGEARQARQARRLGEARQRGGRRGEAGEAGEARR